MSVIANLSASVAAALSPINPHLHGHKKGSHLQSADDTSGGGDSAAQVPAGLQQNLFGSLLNSLEQVIGVQATTPAGAATGTPATTTNTVSAAAQSSLTLLRNPRIDGSPAAKLAGSNLNVTA